MSLAGKLELINRYINGSRQIRNLTMKQISNSPSALTKIEYIGNVLPNLDNFMITDKADGIRHFVVFEYGNMYVISRDIKRIDLNYKDKNLYIFDAELVDEVFYVFDIIVFSGQNVSRLPFIQRYEYMNKLQKSISRDISNIKVKKFVKISKGLDVKKFYKKSASRGLYEIDGIIFTRFDTGGYKRTQHYKWKPPEQLTIDFLAIKSGSVYNLYNGIDIHMFQKLGMDRNVSSYINSEDVHYLDVFESKVDRSEFELAKTYFPVLFKPSIILYSGTTPAPTHIFKYSTTQSKAADIDRQVVELKWDVLGLQWKLVKIRTDRDEELRSGTYFGNNYRIAEMTFQSILNPLRLEDFSKSIQSIQKNTYFSRNQSSEHMAVRKYNSFIKRSIINQQNGSKKIVDLASGKGQDLFTYINNGVCDLLMIEKDSDAIDEIVRRKYIATRQNTYQANENCQGTNIKIINDDLLSKNIIKKIPQYYTEIGKQADTIICNFALHYLISTLKDTQHMCNLIDIILKPGGEFIFTALNGELLYNFLKSKPGQIWNPEKAYKIKLYNGKSDKSRSSKSSGGNNNLFKPFSHIIEINLPCSSVPMKEVLIDIRMLDKEFRKKNIIRVESVNFDKFLKDYNSKYVLTSNDKIFTTFYSYHIYKKVGKKK
jgi:hypothetical protein